MVTPSSSLLPPLIVIVGPTAVGKTALAINLARAFDGEIVNADSRLFYRGMDIGTAKPTEDERGDVPHHLIDILEPQDSMSLATFLDLAHAAIRDILDRGRLPFLVGGTPQYVNALVEGWQVPRVAPDPELRARLDAEAEAHGLAQLEARLRQVDPDAAVTHAGNQRRIIRALEVYELTGIPISAQQSKGPAPYDALELELWRPREVLYARIDARQREQFDAGLVDEVRALLDAGVPPESPSFGSIGYRQTVPYVRGEITREEALERVQFDCHRLVRHQETWFRKNPRLIRIDLEDEGAEDTVAHTIRRFLERRSGLNSVD